MRVVGILAFLCMLTLAGLTGCSQRLSDAQEVFSSAEPTDQSAQLVAEAAARQSSRDGRLPIRIESVKVTSAPHVSVVVAANLVMAADAWDCAYRAADYGALLVPAMLENDSVESVRVIFAQQGEDVVAFLFPRHQTVTRGRLAVTPTSAFGR